MELRNQLPSSHPLTAPVHPPDRVTGPPELHHSEGRYQFGGLRQFKLRGLDNVSAVFGLHVIAYNLIRLGNILKPSIEVA
jgi:hypothetical protein